MRLNSTPGAIVGFVAAAAVVAGCTTAPNAATGVRAGAATSYVDVAGTCAGLSPCFAGLQEAINAANPLGGDTIEVFVGNYSVAEPANPLGPAIDVNKPVTITSHNSADPDDTCPAVATACPTFTVTGPVNIPLQISADNVNINNLAFVETAVPGSNPASAIIYVPADKSADLLHSGIVLSELSLSGARRGIWLSAADASVNYSIFSNQAKDSLFVPAATGALTVQGNTFSGAAGSGKAVLFENQYGSPPTAGTQSIVYNTLYGKSNFAVWNSWVPAAAAGSVALTIDHNSVVNTSGAAVALLPGESGKPGFGMFKSLAITNNILTQAGGDGVYVDYAYSPSPAAVPSAGQIVVDHSLTYSNTPSAGTNDPTGNYGYSATAPAAASLAMFALSTTTDISGADPKLANPAAGDFSLNASSPAIGSGTAKSNIGMWQGVRPIVKRVTPSCASVNDTVKISGSNFVKNSTVHFGSAAATVTDFRAGKAKAWLTVVVPAGSPGSYVDVTVTTSSGSGSLLRGFHYAASDKSGCGANG